MDIDSHPSPISMLSSSSNQIHERLSNAVYMHQPIYSIQGSLSAMAQPISTLQSYHCVPLSVAAQPIRTPQGCNCGPLSAVAQPISAPQGCNSGPLSAVAQPISAPQGCNCGPLCGGSTNQRRLSNLCGAP